MGVQYSNKLKILLQTGKNGRKNTKIKTIMVVSNEASANVARTMIMQEMSKIKNKYKILFDTYTVPVYTY